MEDMDLIKILLGVIVIILILGLVIVAPMIGKQDSKLTISDKEVYAGDSLAVKLTDSNGNAIANETIHVKLSSGDGKVTQKDIKTNSKGKATMEMQIGDYSVDCKFDGNDKLKSSSTTKKINVTKATTKSVSEDKTSSSNSNSGLSEDGYSYYPEYGPEVDSQGVTRESAVANDMHYIEMTVDGDRPGEYVTVGGYVRYDPVAGCYHT